MVVLFFHRHHISSHGYAVAGARSHQQESKADQIHLREGNKNSQLARPSAVFTKIMSLCLSWQLCGLCNFQPTSCFMHLHFFVIYHFMTLSLMSNNSPVLCGLYSGSIYLIYSPLAA